MNIRASFRLPIPFDNEEWKLKTGEDGKAVIQDGKPVFVRPDGTDFIADVPGMYGKITSLTTEAANHRRAKETAETALAAFGDMTPEKATEALDALTRIDQKKLIDAGKVDEVKADITKQFETKLTDADKKFTDLQSKFNKTLLGGAFAKSKFITDKLAVPVDMVEAMFGSAFKVEEDGSIRAYRDGNPVTSRDKPGEVASFDEALNILVNDYPNRDMIMKGSGNSGSGSNGGNGGGNGAQRYNRSEFEKLPPAKQMEVSKAVREGKASIED